MWAIDSKHRVIRHIYGANGNSNVVSLCGLKGRKPLDYLRVGLPKCGKCEIASGRRY